MSLTTCLKKAGTALSAEDKNAILEAARVNRKAGMSTAEAAKAAVRARLEAVQSELAAEQSQVSTVDTKDQPKTLKERAEAMAAKGQPVHQDPGQAPEVATKAVVSEAVAKAADNRDRKPSEMRAELLRMIDEAIPNAKDATDQDVQVYESTAPGTRMTDTEQAEYKRLGTGQPRDKYMQRLAKDKAALHERAAERIGFVDFAVRGDGRFKVLNTVERLKEFRAKVESSPGFKDRAGIPKPDGLVGGEKGYGGASAVAGMIDEGDPQAAVDYAAARGLDIAEVLKGDKARLGKVAGLTPTAEAVGEFEPEAAAEPEALGTPVKRGMTVAQFDAWAKENATRQPEQFAKRTEGVGLFAVTGENKGFKQVAGVVGSRTVADDTRDMRVVYRLDDGRLVWWRQEDGNAYEVAANNPRLTITMEAPQAEREQSERTVLAGTDDEASVLFAGPIDQMDDAEFEDELRMASLTPKQAAAFRALRKPEDGIASQTFDQWVRAQYNGNEYKASYLEAFGGNESRATLASVVGNIDNTTTTAKLLTAAKQEYRSELFKLPREASISLEVWDALDNMAKVEAQRHFYDLDSRITRRDQDATKARVEAERIKKAPYEAAFAEVDAEIRRLDKLPGPPTKKQNELSIRRDRLREAIYQIGQGKEPDGRLIRAAAAPQEQEAPATPSPAAAQSATPSTREREEGGRGDKAKATGAKIGDFGEKLEGARKDYATTLKDAEAVDVAAEPLSKSWPEPDYQKLLDGGADPFVVAFIRAARDEVPTKPQKSWKLKGWVDAVQTLRSASSGLLNGSISRDQLESKLTLRAFDNVRRNVGSRAVLYEMVGHERSLKGITFAEHHYSLYKGQQNVRKWVVEQKAKATMFSNWPRELAVADTKAEMLEQFKAKIGSLDTSPTAKGQAQFVIYRKRGQPGAFVGKKIGREHIDLHKADDVTAARKYMQENVAELEKTLQAYKQTPFERKTENQPRVGDDHRNGAPVTPEVFAETFGFRGVQFGNYVEQGRRQSDLNQAFDGLMDMAAVLGIPPRAISLNGKLGLAFGARGKGGNNAPAAHYEPGNVVINLTKGSGPGSLAHEWWHSLDNYFGKESGAGGYGTGNALGDKTRAEMKAAFDAVKTATQVKSLRLRAAELDKRKSKPYWDTPIELSARSFESYVIAKLQDQGAANDYLANVVSKEFWEAEEALRAGLLVETKPPATFPYPIGDEMPAVRAAFDEFFKTVQTRTDDAGNVALFSRTGNFTPGGFVSPRLLSAEVSKIVANWDQDLADVKVVNRVEDLPDDILQAVRNVGSENEVRGLAMPDGRVFLVAENISSVDEGRFVLFHEVYGHVGMRAFLGDYYTAHMSMLRKANPALAREADAWFDRYGEDEIDARVKAGFSEAKARAMVDALAVEEALADRAGDAPVPKGWQRVLAALQRGLRRLGLGSVADMLEGMSEAETLDLLVNARRTVQAGQRVRAGEVAPAMSRSDAVQTAPKASLAVSRLNRVMREAGWEMEYVDLDLTGEKPKANIRVNRGDGRFLIAKVDSIGRASFETFQRERNLRMDPKNPQARLAPHIDDTFLGRQRFDGARAMLRSMVNYLTDNATGDIALADMRAAWAGVMAAPVKQEQALLDGPAGQEPPAFSRRTDQTQTPEFKRWFGDSKVVDSEGRPLVVYHGTHSDVQAFTGDKVKARFPNSEGFYFASSPFHASVYADSINNAAEGFDPTSRFSKPAAEGGNVMPAYVSLQNPKLITVSEWGTLESAVDGDGGARVRAARAAGHDGVIVTRKAGDDYDGQLVIAFRPEQIKSAIGNSGAFDPTNADIRFSRRTSQDILNAGAMRDAIPPGVQDWITDRTTSQRGFNRIWHRTVGTQLHKAKTNKEFGRAYYAVQDFMKDVSRMATLAAEKAPDMLPQIETLNDLAKLAPTLASPAAYKQRKADIKAASDALFDGTLRYTRDEDGKAVKVDPDSDELGGIVWTPAELKARGLSERAVGMYQQSREAIEQSLDSMLAADLYRQVSVMDPELVAKDPGDYDTLMAGLRRAASSDTPGDAVKSLRDAIGARLNAVQTALDGQPNQHTPGLMQRRQDLRKLQEMIGEKVQRIQDLKDAGYAPLMRFGPYAVDVVGKDGRRVFFGMYESQAAANKAARHFRDDGLTVTQSVMPQKQFEALQGVSPETALLFAEMLGVEKNEAMQVWLKNAVAEQSALKRHIRRKGIEGFDEDGGRVLAAFITSNARAASRALHSQRISEAVENIRQGDVQDEARALAEYVSNPKEEAQAIRSLLFVQYIGGSIASAIVNLTQTVVQTFPFLSQYGGGIKAGQRIGGAVKQALGGKIADSDLAAAVARAEKEGVIKPQEVFQLQAEASRNLGSNLYARSILSAWGSMFQLAEVFNRRVAFIAAYNTAKAEGIADPFKFAENAVDETQSVFNKGNRPNWARGAVGATVFTFKTFTIQYVEFLQRLATAGEPGSPERARGQKAAALALLALVLLAGMKGLPFAEDAEDLIDTVAQALGYNWTTDAQVDKWMNDTLGEVWADIAQHGLSGVPGVPFDVSQRLGMANLLPGTGLLKQSETNKQNQVLEVFGVAGSAVRDATQGQFLPIAIRNLMMGLDTYETGLYRDRRGRAVTEADPLDAALKAIGLQPNVVARAQRDIGRQIELRSLYQAVKEEITDSWAQARFAGDAEGVENARASLRRWNDTNPEARIMILPRTIEQRVIQMRRSKAERTIANAPRPLRATTAEALE